MVYLVVCYLKKKIPVSVTPAYEYPQVFSLFPFFPLLSFIQIYIYNSLLYLLTIDIAINRQNWTSWLLAWVLSEENLVYKKELAIVQITKCVIQFCAIFLGRWSKWKTTQSWECQGYKSFFGTKMGLIFMIAFFNRKQCLQVPKSRWSKPLIQ